MKLPIFSLLLWAALTFNLSAESLQDAKSLIQTKKYKDAAELLEKLLKENGDGLKDEHFYYSARAHYLDANYTAARSSAEKTDRAIS